MQTQPQSNIEAGWKKRYVLRKHGLGDNVTVFLDKSEYENAIARLVNCHAHDQIESWLSECLHKDRIKPLGNAIRAQRHRYSFPEKGELPKKTIDLRHFAWRQLSKFSTYHAMSHSESLEYLCEVFARVDDCAKKRGVSIEDYLSVIELERPPD